MKPGTLLLTIFFMTAGLLPAQSLQGLFSAPPDENQMAALRKGDFLGFNSGKGDAPRFMPKHDLVRFPREFMTRKKPGMFIETMVLIPYPKDRTGLSLRLYNELGAVSTQEGLEYISYNRGNKPYPLITKSWYVKSLKEKSKKIADPVYREIPAEDTRTVYQKDTTFGGNYYRYVYRHDNGAVSLAISNLTNLTVMGVVPVAKPEEVEIHFFVIPVDEGIFCYSIAFITNPPKQEKVLGYDVNVIGSFDKRIRVILGWYKKRLGIQ